MTQVAITPAGSKFHILRPRGYQGVCGVDLSGAQVVSGRAAEFLARQPARRYARGSFYVTHHGPVCYNCKAWRHRFKENGDDG